MHHLVRAYGACLRGPVSSNVRPHKHHALTRSVSALRQLAARQRLRSRHAPQMPLRMQADLDSQTSDACPCAASSVAAPGQARAHAQDEQASRSFAALIASGSKVALARLDKVARRLQSISSGASLQLVAQRQLRDPQSWQRCLRSVWQSSMVCQRLGASSQDRPACSARRAVRPNHSLNRTRYGKHRKPGLRHMVHHLSPGLRRLPPRAG